MKPRVVWLSGQPSHYMAALHRALEIRHPGRTRFLYFPDPKSDTFRAHERAVYPAAAHLVTEATCLGRCSQAWRRICEFRATDVLACGHSPREVAIASLIAKRTGLRCHYWSDTNLYDVVRWAARWRLQARRVAMRTMLQQMDTLLYVGSAGKEYYEWLFPSASGRPDLVWLPYPHVPERMPARDSASVRELRRRLLRPQTRALVLFVGRLLPFKAVDRLLHAVSILPADAREAIRCVIVGDGPESARLRALATQLALGDAVLFEGAVPSDTCPTYMAAADLLVVPSHREPWGLVVNEALSAGTAVVAPHWVGAARDLLAVGLGELLVDNRADTIAGSIAGLLSTLPRSGATAPGGPAAILAGGWTLSGALAVLDRIHSGEVTAA